VHQLDLIRAAAEDVASARILLNERIEALDAIVAAALEHDIPMAKVAAAAQVAGLEEIRKPPASADTVLVA
jgi:hypothetical protein